MRRHGSPTTSEPLRSGDPAVEQPERGAFLSDRRYRFDDDRATVWAAISSVDRYPEWWPWLRSFRGAGLVAGDVWECQIQPPVPYSLHFTVSFDEVVPLDVVRATVSGDVRGTARLELEDSGVGCRARIVSTLVPANRTLRAVARLARPVAQYGHAWVLDTGAEQFTARAL